MKDKFPEIYKTKIDKIKNQVQKEFYYRCNEEKNNFKVNEISKKELLNKINNIFLRPDFVYQADVNIMFKNGNNINKNVVAVKDNYLLTIDGERINIDDIYDVK